MGPTGAAIATPNRNARSASNFIDQMLASRRYDTVVSATEKDFTERRCSLPLRSTMRAG
jgi:hypothetical protein